MGEGVVVGIGLAVGSHGEQKVVSADLPGNEDGLGEFRRGNGVNG